MRLYHTLLAGLGLSLALTACSSEPAGPTTSASEVAQEGSAATDAASPQAPAIGGETAPAATSDTAPAANSATKVIGLEGLGELQIGKPVPSGSSWASRGAQVSDACTTVTSPAYPGVYAIVEKGKVQRITVGKRSDVKLVEGIGVGASERDVSKWFGGFRSEPHKYEPAPAKYLTAPNAGRGEPAVRFEIGQDGKVSMIHVGIMPVLGYVEGCG